MSTRPDDEAIDRAIETQRAHENLIRMFSADLECPHGNVPGTQPPRCGCFTRRRDGARRPIHEPPTREAC